MHLLMGLGAGVLLGAVFFDLLPEALSVAAAQGWSSRFVLGLSSIWLSGYLSCTPALKVTARMKFTSTLVAWAQSA